jgi:acetyltransferase-like isoleucine patch superfamily enzyme
MGMMGLQRWIRLKKAQLYTKAVKSDFGSFGKGSIIVTPFLSYNPKGIHVAENVSIYSDCWLDCIGEYAGRKFEPCLEIGDRTSVGSGAHFIACGRVSIGKDVVIAQRVYISDNLHGYENISQDIMSQPLVNPGAVTIEDEVWLGEGVCVLPNVTIGKHSVIGSNSVVTSDIEPYSVAVGVPAKIIRKYNDSTKCWERV